MESDLNNKIKEIGSMFGIDNIPENIGDVVNSLLSNNNHEQNTKEIKSENYEQNMNDEYSEKNNINLSGLLDNENIIRLINKINDKNKNNKQDKKIKLLYALEPFLNDKRKEKISNCVKFLAFADIAKDLNIL